MKNWKNNLTSTRLERVDIILFILIQCFAATVQHLFLFSAQLRAFADQMSFQAVKFFSLSLNMCYNLILIEA